MSGVNSILNALPLARLLKEQIDFDQFNIV